VFRRAIDSAPDNVSAHHNLATAHRLRGEWAAALSELEIAVQLEPDAAPLLTDLAMLLAASPVETLRDSGRAIATAERAAALSGRRLATTLDVLGVAYAANGRFEAAIESGRAALALGPDEALAAAIRERIALYQQRRPYTMR
jgi:tetratricopeptide (TPR) repeat protein